MTTLAEPQAGARGLDRPGLVRVVAATASLAAATGALAEAGGVLRGAASPLSGAATAAVLALAAGQLTWAVAVVSRAGTVAARPFAALAAAGTLGWLATAAGSGGGPATALGAATLTALAGAGGLLAARGERAVVRAGHTRLVRPGVQLAVLVAACTAVAAVLTPALAASPAGDGATSHADHLAMLDHALGGHSGVGGASGHEGH